MIFFRILIFYNFLNKITESNISLATYANGSIWFFERCESYFKA